MSDRIRLTQRQAARNVKADAATPETPIDLGKERPYRKIDKYHKFEPKLNHWIPDMRHEWKDNPREESGHGIPKNVKIYNAAKKATKLASVLLGKNASDEELLAQAQAFMRMGDRALTASLKRVAGCEECEAPKTEEACKVAEAAEEAPKTEEACTAKEECKDCEVKTEEACKVAEAAEEAPATEEKEEKPAVEEKPAEEAPAAEEEVDVEVDDASGDEAVVTFEEDLKVDEEPDAKLAAALFKDAADDDEVETACTEKTASHKVGLKKLAGGQPQLVRIASKNADELAGLWDKWGE